MATNMNLTAGELQEFTSAVHGITEQPMFAGAKFGFDVRDALSGSAIFQHNAYDIFPGASTTKIPTCVYALALLGPNFRFRTKLVRCGEIDESGTLRGDLVLVAAGDPNLSNRVTSQDTLEFENLDRASSGPKARLIQRDPLQVIRAFAQGAHDAGIRRVTGTVLIDIHFFAEGERELGSGATISPVAVNDNVIDIEVTAGARPGDPLTYRLSPPSGYVRFIDRASTGEKSSEPILQFSKEYREMDGTWSVTVSGSVPAGSVSMAAFPVESPSRFARTLLIEALAAGGIVIEGGLFGSNTTKTPTTADTAVVVEHVSPPLVEVTKIVLKVSQNLHAEMLMPVIGATLKGLRGEEARKAGYACGADLLGRWEVDTTGQFQGDACGVYGHFSPEFMSRLLVRVAASEIHEPLLHGLPIMGRDGTLWDIQQGSPAAGHVTAKTGTLFFEDLPDRNILFTCKGLAGYVSAKSGRRLAFTIYLHNFLTAHASQVKPGQVLGELASAIYEHL